MMTETDDAGYKGVVKMRGLPFHATVGDGGFDGEWEKILFVRPSV